LTILPVADGDLAYDLAGEGRPLLLLHGLGGRGSDWAAQVAHFQPRYRVITCDVLGHGASARPPGPYSVARFARGVAALLRTVAPEPAHLVGLSMGGMVAFQLAVDAPDLIRSLVIVNSGPELVPRNAAERWALRMRVFTVRWLGMRRMGTMLGERLFPDDPDRRADFLARFLTNDRHAYLAATRALIGWSVADRIEAIAAPTLAVVSDQDYTPPSRKEEYVRRIRGARMVVVPNARHALPMERPDAFNQVLDAFLAEVDGTATTAGAP
jgi:3-oxoadipate enol-lactonase